MYTLSTITDTSPFLTQKYLQLSVRTHMTWCTSHLLVIVRVCVDEIVARFHQNQRGKLGNIYKVIYMEREQNILNFLLIYSVAM